MSYSACALHSAILNCSNSFDCNGISHRVARPDIMGLTWIFCYRELVMSWADASMHQPICQQDKVKRFFLKRMCHSLPILGVIRKDTYFTI